MTTWLKGEGVMVGYDNNTARSRLLRRRCVEVVNSNRSRHDS